MPAVDPTYTPPPPTKAERIEAAAREGIGGDKRAAVRRILLWTLTIVLVAGDAPAWAPLAPIALLVATDGLL